MQGLLEVSLQLDNMFAETALEFQVLLLFRTDEASVIHRNLLLTSTKIFLFSRHRGTFCINFLYHKKEVAAHRPYL